MSKVLFSTIFILSLSITKLEAQSPIVEEMMEAVTEITGSFMDNPYHHDNSQKIYEFSGRFKGILEEMYRRTLLEAGDDLVYISNLMSIIRSIEHITAGIVGHYPASVEAVDFEILNPVFDAFGWSRSLIFTQADLLFYEYQKGNFRMVLVKNRLPRKDGGDYNAYQYECYTQDVRNHKEEIFIGRYIFGGNYQFVECGDDKTNYKVISKVTCHR